MYFYRAAIFLLFILIFQTCVYSQTTLSGYKSFHFGQTKEEIINELKRTSVDYSESVMKDFPNLNRISFTDTIIIITKTFYPEVFLEIDDANNFKLFAIDMKIQSPCHTIDSSYYYRNEIVKYISGLYKPEYDTDESVITLPAMITFQWIYSNGYIKAQHDVKTYYNYPGYRSYYLKPDGDGVFEFGITLVDNELLSVWENRKKDEIKKKGEELKK
jgi:hypothetical protein